MNDQQREHIRQGGHGLQFWRETLPGSTLAGRDEQRAAATADAAAPVLPGVMAGQVGTATPVRPPAAGVATFCQQRWAAVRQANFEAIRDLIRTSVLPSELSGITKLLTDLEDDTFLDGMDRAALTIEIGRRCAQLNRMECEHRKPRWQLPAEFGGAK